MLSIKKLFTTAVAVVNLVSAAQNSVAVYWGQNGFGQSTEDGGQQPLRYYCDNSDVDIVVLSFVTGFPQLVLNFANQCGDTFSDGLLHCSAIGDDIEYCQGNGKKVLLSLGGSTDTYGFTTDEQGTAFAQVLWDKFGEGTGDDERPFDAAVVDGFDFDIEVGTQTGYVALATALIGLFATGTKQYYLSAAPQCPIPDAHLSDLLSTVPLDYVFIQFYNNYCNVDTADFNIDDWQTFAETAPNSNVELFVGLPGADVSSITGYIDAEELASNLELLRSMSNFAGVSLWDASLAWPNVDTEGDNFAVQVKNVLNGEPPSSSSSTEDSSSSEASSTEDSSSSEASSTEDSSSSEASSTEDSSSSEASSTEDSSSSEASSTEDSSSSEASSTEDSSSSEVSSTEDSSSSEASSTEDSSSSEASSTEDPTSTEESTTEDPTSTGESTSSEDPSSSSQLSSNQVSTTEDPISSAETTSADPSSNSLAGLAGPTYYGNTSTTAFQTVAGGAAASSSGESYVTISDIQTTVITITSCSENKCHITPVTTGYVYYTSIDTVYTTYCPLTANNVVVKAQSTQAAPGYVEAQSSSANQPLGTVTYGGGSQPTGAQSPSNNNEVSPSNNNGVSSGNPQELTSNGGLVAVASFVSIGSYSSATNYTTSTPVPVFEGAAVQNAGYIAWLTIPLLFLAAIF
ncbi:CHT2 [[Candida] subhashii]|uniref:chitinase n=1 Tax=[Candida] subhashii TaxID=561895 RepID=A0A8J5QDY2_9ASCO|nr:CHT2 [[Candida] subhashii]KAG7664289.1 CHT2 [[Candida] subhashii]